MIQRGNGVYYTFGNPFKNPAFAAWANSCNISSHKILEPFAGRNSLIEHLQSLDLCSGWESFDIAPAADGVQFRDTIKSFPVGFSVCVTNPPWLAKNSATRRGLSFPESPHNDIYKVALELCLENCQSVCSLIPESFVRSGLFVERLSAFVSLTGKLFEETDNPVGMALFNAEKTDDFAVWHDDSFVGNFSEIQSQLPNPKKNIDMAFGDPDGLLGLIGIDNTKEPSIRFCHSDELGDYPISQKNRAITKISGICPSHIKDLNEFLRVFRESTQDVLLTSFKGVRKDGRYRRRLDWNTARRIINHIC